MGDGFTIILPKTTNKSDLASIKADIQKLDTIEDVTQKELRGVDLNTIKMIVEVIGALGTATDLIKKVVEIIRGQGVKGVKIKFPNGKEISVDEAKTIKDIERIGKMKG